MIFLLLVIAIPVAADGISATASVIITGARYSLDGIHFMDAPSAVPVYVPRGTVEVVFVGTVTNNDPTPGNYLYLNDQTGALPSHLSLDSNYFFDHTPGALDPHSTGNQFYSYSGGIFGVLLDSTTPSGTYQATYAVLGGGSSTVLDAVGAAQSFTIVVTPPPRLRITIATSRTINPAVKRPGSPASSSTPDAPQTTPAAR